MKIEDAPVELAEEYALPGEGPDRVDRDIPGKTPLWRSKYKEVCYFTLPKNINRNVNGFNPKIL